VIPVEIRSERGQPGLVLMTSPSDVRRGLRRPGGVAALLGIEADELDAATRSRCVVGRAVPAHPGRQPAAMRGCACG